MGPVVGQAMFLAGTVHQPATFCRFVVTALVTFSGPVRGGKGQIGQTNMNANLGVKDGVLFKKF